MVLSEQQKEIIEKSKQLIKNQKLKINAFAGTGKTTTLKAITEQISNQRFLYLAFNNDIVKEAKKSFKSNVFTTTINSLAYNKIISKYKLTIQKQKFEPIIIGEILGIDFSDAYDVLKIYTLFCNSNYKTIEQLKGIYFPKRLSSFEYAELFYKKIKAGEIDCDHSFYLKEYELNGYAAELKFDFVLLDEAQDTNPVTLSIFEQFNSKKILVGDTHQTIYQFRDSVNAMDIIDCNYSSYLTTTYRCSNEIVYFANKVLKTYKKEKVELISGSENQDKTINEIAYIARTNSEIINFIQKIEEFDCKKDLNDIFGLSIAIYMTYISDKKNEYNNKKYNFLKKFIDIKALKEYAEKTYNIELSDAIRNAQMLKGYLCVLENKAKLKQNPNSKNKLMTAHGSKGLEFDKVVIAKDFKDPETCEASTDFICESNLLYVAITRAKKEIIFENEWFY